MAAAAQPQNAFQFKRMASDGQASTASAGNGPEAAFKPLFHGEAGETAAEQSRDNPDLLLEQAYREGFEKGQLNGAQQAHEMAMASMSPGLTAFVNCLKMLTRQGESARSHSENALELALLISSRITGEPASLQQADLTELKTLISERLMQNHRLQINMNPDDLAELNAILTSESIELAEIPLLSIEGNSAVQPGELRFDEQGNLPREELDVALLEALSSALTAL